MSANFLGREKGYKNVQGFGEGGTSLLEAYSPAATYAERIDRLFEEIAAMGYRGIDLWTAHCSPDWATKQHYDGLLAASSKHGVELVSIAGGLGPELEQLDQVCRMARDIGCPVLGLGCGALPGNIAEVAAILNRYNVQLGVENHPDEKTPAVMLEKIGCGRYENIGVTCDTGWWGTHRYPVIEAIDALKEHLLLVHLKNIKKAGEHEAARWDNGCLDLKSIVRHLKRISYSGWISIEYEPMEHDPTEECREFLSLAKDWWHTDAETI